MIENGTNPAEKNDPPAIDDDAEVGDLVEALSEGLQGEELPQDAEEAVLDPLEQLATENAELQDRLLRTAAEMENLRRRTERERAEATLYAATNFARDMLSVSDNMDRALEAVSTEQREAADDVTRNLLDGVELVQRELLNTFERHGIRRLSPLGERFDPHFHQAMFEIPDTETESGTVVQVVQPGFAIGDRVLRPAMVGVAKGGPKPGSGKPADAANDQSGDELPE